MTPAARASLTVVAVGILWGLYWAPLRQLDALTAAGPWVSFTVTLAGGLALLPAAWLGRSRLAAAELRALASTALGGAAFVLYSNGLLFGNVAVVILLFYLTPVWSTLIGRYWFGWPITGGRAVALACGFTGIALVLRGSHDGLPLPQTLGDWLGLASGLFWAIASSGIHRHARTRPAETNFVFLAGAAAMALALALVLAPAAAPQALASAVPPALGWTLLIGGLWWAASLSAFMWATRMLEPARVGILLMSEVIMGALSAAVFTQEPFGWLVGAGTVLVIAAAVLETALGARSGA